MIISGTLLSCFYLYIFRIFHDYHSNQYSKEIPFLNIAVLCRKQKKHEFYTVLITAGSLFFMTNS